MSHPIRETMFEPDIARQPRPRRDIVSIHAAAEEISVARCPACRCVLIARMTTTGPRFVCRCPSKARAA